MTSSGFLPEIRFGKLLLSHWLVQATFKSHSLPIYCFASDLSLSSKLVLERTQKKGLFRCVVDIEAF